MIVPVAARQATHRGQSLRKRNTHRAPPLDELARDGKFAGASEKNVESATGTKLDKRPGIN